MELRKYGGHVGTSPITLDCRSLFIKAFFCRDFIPELWSRMAVSLQSNTEAVSIKKAMTNFRQYVGSVTLHAVVDNQGGWEAHDVRYRHEGNELRQVHKQFWGHSWELMNKGSSHCFHGLQFFLRGLTEKNKRAGSNSVCSNRLSNSNILMSKICEG